TGLLKVGATLLLCAPYPPMLFMGEEWAAGTPWQYFSSHPQRKLANAVTRGRRREFAAHGWPRGSVPNPQDPRTFQRSKLDWSEPDRPPHRDILEFYRALIRLRRSRPELSDPHLDQVSVRHGADWLVMRRGRLGVAANLAEARLELPMATVQVVLASDSGVATTDGVLELPGETAAVVELA
ncbi:MAG: DUF3459 domain-containing protein, partial [Micromonosporaceae bacterium]|nr:DUF3459 domain-containing protein [Micromonosporaceae bacterium]